MLTEGDIDYMQAALEEIYALRVRPVTVIYVEKTYDDITGETLGEVEHVREVNAVVTEISTRRADGSRGMAGGIEYKQGDAKFDIKSEQIDDIAEKLVRVEYDGKKYELLGGDKKGIGKRNRIEFIGRVIV